jgi:uncharacterized membrane protein YgcG
VSSTAPAAATVRPGKNRTVRIVFSLVALLLAPLSWFWTIDDAALRSTGLTAWMMCAGALLLALSAAATDRRRWVRVVALCEVATVGLFAWLFFGFARLPSTALAQELASAPDFTLPDHLGRPVSLAERRAHGPVLLVFYRGHW